MKYTEEQYNYVYDLWESGKSFEEISKTEIPLSLSLKRIRNIIYALDKAKKTDMMVYAIYLNKFSELQNTDAAIQFVYSNQPKKRLSENSIRRIINQTINSKKTKNKKQLNN